MNGKRKKSRIAAGRFVLSFYLGLSVPAAGMAFSAGQAPEQAVREFHESLKALDFDARQEIKNDAMRQKVNAYLDLEHMAREALHIHWDKAAPAERQEFMSLLWQLVESTAYKNSAEMLRTGEIVCQVEPGEKDTHKVLCSVQEEDGVLETRLEYGLHQSESGWKIKDVILDEVSLITDLRYQFDHLIEENGFDALMSRMREKLSRVRRPLS